LFIVYYRVGIEIPKIEVRFENLSVEGDAYDGTRALPTLINATLNVIEVYVQQREGYFYQVGLFHSYALYITCFGLIEKL
jgi:hypothetical protein